MKTFLSIFFFCLFFSMQGYGQIRISGIENVKTQTNNTDATFIRKEVQVTRTTTGNGKTSVISNEIKDATTTETKKGVSVELDAQTTKEDSTESAQIVIDLQEAAKAAAAQNNGLSPVGSPGSTTQNVGPKVQLEKDQYFTVFSPEGIALYTSNPNAPRVPATTTTKTIVEEKVDIQKTTNTWAVGGNIGFATVQGDVRSKVGFGLGLTVQKAINRRFGVRYQALFMQAYGQDWQLQENNSNYLNYKTRISDHTFQAVIGLNGRTPKRVLFNALIGAGFSTLHSWRDGKDINGQLYDYSDILIPVTRGDKGQILGALNALQDNGYETPIGIDPLKAQIRNTQITPSLMAGLGMSIKATNRIDVNVEHRISWHNSDKLDGYLFEGKDLLHYTSIGLNFKIGNKDMAAWWDPKRKVQITTYEGVISNRESETGVVKNEPINTLDVKSDEKAYKEDNIIGYVFFDVNDAKVKQEYYAELYKLDKFLEDNPEIKIAIVGHVDSKGTEFDNKTIAKDRAQSVYHFLTGIFKMDPSRFETYYEGENNFAVPEGNIVFARNQSEKNKSVTIIIK